MRLTLMMPMKSVLLPLLLSIALIGCSKKSDAIQCFDKDGSIYFCGNNKWPWGMDNVPEWSLAFLSDGTVIHTYVMSNYTSGKHDVMQSKATYRVSGDSVYFEDWCSITPKARAEELSADRSTEYMERPKALTLELVEGRAVGLRPEF